MLIDNPAPDDDWLARREPEIVLDPDLPIVDAHHHLWEARPWPYAASDYRADAARGHRIVQSVCIEGGSYYRSTGPPALRSVGEVEALRAVGDVVQDKLHVAAAIVATADFAEDADPRTTIDALVAAGGGRLRGIRYSAAAHPDPGYRGRFAARPMGLLALPAVARSVALLAERGLLFETWLLHEQLDDLDRLAAACPEATIVLDHLGGPLAVGRYREDPRSADRVWRAGLARLAMRPNVRLKLGGLGMIALGATFRDQPLPPSSRTLAEAWAPRILAAIDMFGAERCMFESNFPVDRGQADWVALWNAFKQITVHLPATTRHDLFAGVARRSYKLINDQASEKM